MQVVGESKKGRVTVFCFYFNQPTEKIGHLEQQDPAWKGKVFGKQVGQLLEVHSWSQTAPYCCSSANQTKQSHFSVIGHRKIAESVLSCFYFSRTWPSEGNKQIEAKTGEMRKRFKSFSFKEGAKLGLLSFVHACTHDTSMKYPSAGYLLLVVAS